MAEEERNDLEERARALVREAFRAGGIGRLRAVEDAVAREAARLRRGRAGAEEAEAPVDPATVHRDRYPGIIGNSQAMLRLFALLDKVAPSGVPVLIQGESGTGKELVARAIHRNSPRKDRPFLAENCAAIPETLLESELFGYKRGAFTGADRDKVGLFVAAHGGTVFLDEIGDMSPAMQQKLLRVLQDGEVRPVGGNAVKHVDVRVLSASNRDLRALVEAHRFREDLYFRLNTVTVVVPPLRERREDIPDLVRHFVEKFAAEMGITPPGITDRALAALRAWHWPGNVRELENEVRRALAFTAGKEVVDLEDLSEEVRSADG